MKEKNIQELAKRMGLVTVEDMCQYTIAQLVVKIANKVNELVGEVWRFETDVQEVLKTQNENIQYLLGEGLHLEVENIFDGWVQDGTFDTLINQTALKKVNDRLDNVDEIQAQTNAQLSERGKYDIISKDFINVSNKTPNYIHVMVGIDSLTNGAGGSSWCNYFRDKAFAQLGCGGLGYIGLDNNTIGDFGSWGTSAPSVYNNSTYERYSFDRKGIVMSSGHSLNLNFINKDFDNCKIIYLKHPKGGSFDYKWVVSGATTYNCNTNSAIYDLGVVELNGNGAGANGKIGINNITNGEVVIFGVLCTSNNGGLLFSKIGKGGEPFKNHANLNSEFREKWLDILKPDYFLFNGGTNDEKTVQANEYGQLVEKYIRSFLNKEVKVTLITPNDMADLTYLPTYAPVLKEYAENNKCSYVSHAKILGSYESANARGLQLDGCHPNNFGNELLAGYWLNRFGLSSMVESKPFARVWATGDISKEYFAKLTNVSKYIEASTKTGIYNLGFLNAYTGGTISLLVHGQEGKNHLLKEVNVSFANNTVVNQCTWVGLPTISEKHKAKDGNITSLDFDITCELVNDKLLISITPNMVHSSSGGRGMYFNVTGNVSCAYVGTTGQLIYENEI